ncbi:hypothetical protein [Demequina sp.]|uniref:hypothetical protein n=1 Tax=Demequina sp. TaxID=2050685 RepID=UPI0025CC13B1|nr:hypothetical protein [Demequina sp.]
MPTETVTAEPEISAAPVPTETVTADPEPTAAPEATETSTPEPTPAPDESEPEPESTTWWPWLLLGAAVLVLAGLWWRAWSVRNAWDKRMTQARSEFSWLEDSLIPQIVSKPSAAEAAALWQAARPRVLDLDQELHALTEDAPSSGRTDVAQRGLDALRVLGAAIDADSSTQAATDADALRARRAALDEARHRAQTWIASPQK